ncbi:MAG: DsbC family protein [Betaproteobacteria bacterium]|nr:DsbC family protein [Betaproteobacteria bacterium]
MNLLASLSAAMLALVLALPAFAQDLERVKADLKKKFPEAQIETTRKTGYAGLIEVTGGGEVFYTDEKTTFLLLGSLIDAKTRENVTEARVRKLSAVKFDSLPLESSIKIVRGNGSRRIAIFEDPNCGYCKRFEKDLAGVTDLTIHVFLYPILSPESATKSKAVWCAPDRAKAWLDLMLKNADPDGATNCENPIDKLVAYGREKRITGTPTIFFEDGERVPGAMPIAAFEKRLADAKAAGKP